MRNNKVMELYDPSGVTLANANISLYCCALTYRSRPCVTLTPYSHPQTQEDREDGGAAMPGGGRHRRYSLNQRGHFSITRYDTSSGTNNGSSAELVGDSPWFSALPWRMPPWQGMPVTERGDCHPPPMAMRGGVAGRAGWSRDSRHSPWPCRRAGNL